jgi:hypothetical protein
LNGATILAGDIFVKAQFGAAIAKVLTQSFGWMRMSLDTTLCEWAMSAPSRSASSRTAASRMEQFRELGSRLPQGSLALGVGVGIFAAVVFGVPKSALLHDVPAAKDQTWAGHLEAPTGPTAVSP